jgi:thymidylate synthase
LSKKINLISGVKSDFLIFYLVIKFYILTFLRKTIFIFLLNKNFFNMKNYLQLLREIKERGVATGDRTGTGTLTLPGYHYACPLYMDNDGIIHNFPLLTTKKVSLKSVFEELMWKLRGDTNIRYLLEHNNHIWTEWPFQKWLKKTGQFGKIQMWEDEEKTRYSDEWIQKKAEFEQKILNDSDFCRKWGNLGKTYGYQFRNFGALDMDINIPEDLKKKFSISDVQALCLANPGKDQLMEAVHLIKDNPESRRIIISLWNPNELDEESTLLPPCPAFYQFFANEDGMLHLNLYQRSCDTFLGVPYNTAQDALFLCMMAQVTGRKPGVFNHMFGDAHIYLNHLDQVNQQLERVPNQLPSLKINPKVKDILDFTWSDFELIDYNPQKPIKAPVSI